MISQSELLRMTRPESLLRKCLRAARTCRLRNAHANLLNIRRALARPDFRPR